MKYLKLILLGAVIGVLLALAQGVLADESLERDSALELELRAVHAHRGHDLTPSTGIQG